MATTNFIVSSLPDYVQTNRDLILKTFGLIGTGTRQRIGLQTGIKKSAYLNFLDIDPVLQDGSDCEFSPAGTVELSQREINVATIKVDLDICPKKLLGKYAEYLVRVNATADSLPFEQYIINGVIDRINEKIEKLIWQGNKTLVTDTDLKWIDGFLAQFAADADVIPVTLTGVTSAYAGITSVYLALPAAVIKRGGLIFVGPELYRAFVMELVNKNFFHYSGPADAAPEEYVLPGTNVKVVNTPGLEGLYDIVGTFGQNLVYGTDMENDEEDIDLWFSRDDRVFKFTAAWNSGVAYHFPDQIAHGALGSAPVIA